MERSRQPIAPEEIELVTNCYIDLYKLGQRPTVEEELGLYRIADPVLAAKVMAAIHLLRERKYDHMQEVCQKLGLNYRYFRKYWWPKIKDLDLVPYDAVVWYDRPAPREPKKSTAQSDAGEEEMEPSEVLMARSGSNRLGGQCQRQTS